MQWLEDLVELIKGIASGAIPCSKGNNYSDGASEKMYGQYLAKRTDPNLWHEMTLYSCTVTHGNVFIVDNETRKADARKTNVAASGLSQTVSTIGGAIYGGVKGAKKGKFFGVLGTVVGAVIGFGISVYCSNMASDSEIDRYPTLQNGYYREYTVTKIYYSSEVQWYPLGGGAYNLGRWVEVHHWTYAIGCNDYLESWCSEPISYTYSSRFVIGGY